MGSHVGSCYGSHLKMVGVENAQVAQEHGKKPISTYHALAVVLAFGCILCFVDAVIPQVQMIAFGGHLPITNIVAKLAVVASVALGLWLRPMLQLRGLPVQSWLICIAFLICDSVHLIFSCHLSFVDTLHSYNSYYALMLIGVILPFRGALTERFVTRGLFVFFAVSALIGLFQYFTAIPVLYLESADGNYRCNSCDFYERLRAFGFFSSPLLLGYCAALFGAYGIAILRQHRARAVALITFSAIACYISLTRTCYLVFLGAATYAALLTFGKKPKRGLWTPLLYLGFGILVLLQGMKSIGIEYSDDLKNSSSVLDRLVEWTYYSQQFLRADPLKQLLGLGVIQNDKLSELVLAPIDNLILMLLMHVGIIGALIFGAYMVNVWLSLRRAALVERQPFLIAAASLWSTIGCSGVFNGYMYPFGAVFMLAMLCEKKRSDDYAPGVRTDQALA